MRIYVMIKGDTTEKGTYCFFTSTHILPTDLFSVHTVPELLFCITTKLIRIPNLKNTLENLNSKEIVFAIKNENIIAMIQNTEFKQAGLDLLKNEIIKLFRIR